MCYKKLMSWLKGISYFLAFLALQISPLEGSKVALTFDDAPMPASALYDLEGRVQVYLDVLKDKGAVAAFFCVGKHLELGGGIASMRRLCEGGHLLANHSYSHLHSSKLSMEDFIKEIKDTENLLRKYACMRMWFRFPFLDYGNRTEIGGSEDKKNLCFVKLKKMGYSNGYVTINTFDWYVNSLLLKAIKAGQTIDFDKLKIAYLFLIEEWIDAFDAFWQQDLGLDVKHVMLMHQNDINALYLADVIDLIHKKSWTLISPEEAFAEELPPLGDLYFQKFGRNPTAPLCLTTEHIDEVISATCPFTDEHLQPAPKPFANCNFNLNFSAFR